MLREPECCALYEPVNLIPLTGLIGATSLTD
jgi:hypothetical protein